MAAATRSGSGLLRLLGLLPRPVLAALDAWSARVALQRAERRRTAAPPRAGGTH